MTIRSTRSRVASPGRGSGDKRSPGPASSGNDASKDIGGSRRFMEQWLEPEVQSKASYEEHGLVRGGVVENMLALGTLPKVPAKKRSMANSQRNSSTPNVGRKEKPGVRKIILHPPASASKSKHAADDGEDTTSVSVAGEVDEDVVFTDLPVSKSSSRRSAAHQTSGVMTDADYDGDYQPAGKKSKSAGPTLSGAARGTASHTQTPADTSTPGHDSASRTGVSETPTPSLRKSSKRAAASVASLAAAKSASLEAAAETVRKVLQRAQSQKRLSTARNLQTLYNENPGDLELLEMIGRIFALKSRTSESSMWTKMDRALEERRSDQRENFTGAAGQAYEDSDSEIEEDGGKSMMEHFMQQEYDHDSHFAAPVAGSKRTGGAKSKRQSGVTIGGSSRDMGDGAAVEGAVSLDADEPGLVAENTSNGKRKENAVKGGKARKSTGSSTPSKEPVADEMQMTKSSSGEASRPSSSESQPGSSRMIRIKSNRPRLSPSENEQSSKRVDESGGSTAAPVSPTPVRRIKAFSSSAKKAAAAASAATFGIDNSSGTGKSATALRLRTNSLSSDSSLSSLSSVDLEEDTLLSDGDGDQPMESTDEVSAVLANQSKACKGNKGRGSNAPSIKITAAKGKQRAVKNPKTGLSSKAKEKKGAPSSTPAVNSIISSMRRATEIYQLSRIASQEPVVSSAGASSRASPSVSVQIEEAEKARWDSVDELKKACVTQVAAHTVSTESAIRGQLVEGPNKEGTGIQLRPLHSVKQSTPTSGSIDREVESTTASKFSPGVATDSSLSSVSSEVAGAESHAMRDQKGKGSLKRPHDEDMEIDEPTPPRQPIKTPPRESTPSLPPSKKQRTGPRVKQSPKKGGVTSASSSATIRPPSRSEQEVGSYVDNDDFCSACGFSGELLCCDNCVKAFHFGCIDVCSDKLPDQWFCWECRLIKAPSTLSLTPTRGAFSHLELQLERNNPRAFKLPVDIREYFEGIKTALDGSYEDILPPVKKQAQKGTESIDWYKIRENDTAVLCKVCHQPSDTIRPIIPCSKCGLYWHLDCLDDPLSVPPVLKTWACPLHIDNDALAVIISGPAHRYRKVKNATPITPAFSRGNRNNGIIELEDDLDEHFNDYEKRRIASRAAGWTDPETFGRTYKLQSSAVMEDFIDEVRRTRESYTYTTTQEQTGKRQTMALARRAKPPMPQSPPTSPDLSTSEVTAVLTLATLSSTSPIPHQQQAPIPLPPAIPASPAPTHGHSPTLPPKTPDLSVLLGQLAAGTTSGDALSDGVKNQLRMLMGRIQVALGDETVTHLLERGVVDTDMDM